MFSCILMPTDCFLLFTHVLTSADQHSIWTWNTNVSVDSPGHQAELQHIQWLDRTELWCHHSFLCEFQAVLFPPGVGQVRDQCTVVMSPLQYCTRPGLPGPGVTTSASPEQMGTNMAAGQRTSRPEKTLTDCVLNVSSITRDQGRIIFSHVSQTQGSDPGSVDPDNLHRWTPLCDVWS